MWPANMKFIWQRVWYFDVYRYFYSIKEMGNYEKNWGKKINKFFHFFRKISTNVTLFWLITYIISPFLLGKVRIDIKISNSWPHKIVFAGQNIQYLDRSLRPLAVFWSKTTLNSGCVSGTWLDPTSCKMGLFFLRSLALPLSVPIYRHFQSNGANWQSFKLRKKFLYNREY